MSAIKFNVSITSAGVVTRNSGDTLSSVQAGQFLQVGGGLYEVLTSSSSDFTLDDWAGGAITAGAKIVPTVGNVNAATQQLREVSIYANALYAQLSGLATGTGTKPLTGADGIVHQIKTFPQLALDTATSFNAFGLGVISDGSSYPRTSIDDVTCPGGFFKVLSSNTGDRPLEFSPFGYMGVNRLDADDISQLYTDLDGKKASRVIRNGAVEGWDIHFNSSNSKSIGTDGQFDGPLNVLGLVNIGGTDLARRIGENKTVSLKLNSGHSTTAIFQYNLQSFVGTTFPSADVFDDTTGEKAKNFHMGLLGGKFFNSARFSIVQAGLERLSISNTGTLKAFGSFEAVGDISAGNLNLNEFGGGGSVNDYIAHGHATSSTTARFYLPLQSPVSPASITLVSNFKVIRPNFAAVASEVTSIVLHGNSSNKIASLNIDGLSGLTANEPLLLRSGSTTSKVTVNF